MSTDPIFSPLLILAADEFCVGSTEAVRATVKTPKSRQVAFVERMYISAVFVSLGVEIEFRDVEL